MSKRLVIEITSLVAVDFVSGIQRVVREIVTRMLNRQVEDIEFVLVAYSEHRQCFYRIPVDRFLSCYIDRTIKSESLRKGDAFILDDLGPGDLFFDIDSVWNNRMRRSFLLPILKNRGVRIAAMVYDIIPILFPQYCDEQTTVRFMDYIGAHLQYADLIISNTDSTLRDVERLSVRIGVRPVPGICAPLGADFKKRRSGGNDIDSRVLALKDKRYLLCVGTVEPRKNHAFLLEQYKANLRDAGFALVIAGRPGWNVDALITEMRAFDSSDENFFYFPNANDDTIDHLYQYAFFTVFPTEYEGYGLPLIESILRGTPVLASDIPVLREVGGEYCDYFSLENKAKLHDILIKYDTNPQEYQKRRDSLKNYIPFSWEMAEDVVFRALKQIYN
jgi:glycosyltransferase involved in cell wall biosynthesis